MVKAGSAMWKSNNLIATFFKGTAIDYYTISFSDAEETYSIVNTSENPIWIHNVTKFNVTAHNCAGQSDPVIIYIYHGMSYISILMWLHLPLDLVYYVIMNMHCQLMFTNVCVILYSFS